jgi:N utilization substance protein B
MARRREGRIAALKLLYQKDLHPDVAPQAVTELLAEFVEDAPLRAFAWDLYEGTVTNLTAIDEQIQSVAHNWRLSRMTPTDRNVIRMGFFEMSKLNTPPAVVLNECIEIAKLFGTEQSGTFVNGILDKLIPQQTSSEPAPE